MGKKCMICGQEAVYMIKNTSDAYCKDCASDCFSDLSFLQSVEEQAQELKELVKQKIEDSDLIRDE
ncbi:hypothetical protein KY336_02460 [Candidatus Woesearchaeota archaeon]|nr:hypothetical protein [Candidatus Woesearchaeota archaeon]